MTYSVSMTYINLDRSVDRRLEIERQIDLLGLKDVVKRFSAIPADAGKFGLTAGEWGCLQSHRNAIDTFVGDDILVILEDDVVFSPRIASVLNAIEGSRSNPDWDVIWLGFLPQFFETRTMTRLCALVHEVRRSVHDFALFDAKGLYGWGTFAYAINPASRSRIVAAIDSQITAGQALPIDTLLRELVFAGKLRGEILLPFAVMVDKEKPSTITSLGRPRNLDEEFFADMTALFMPDSDHATGLTGVGAAYAQADPFFRERAISDAICKRMIAETAMKQFRD